MTATGGKKINMTIQIANNKMTVWNGGQKLGIKFKLPLPTAFTSTWLIRYKKRHSTLEHISKEKT
jgi:hypothetical protein